MLVSAFIQQDAHCGIVSVQAALESFVRPWMRNLGFFISLHLGENASMADRIGQQLGNYRLLRVIGQGAFAEVYLGEEEK